MPQERNLNDNPSYHTLSKNCKISQNVPLTSTGGLESNYLCVSGVIDKNGDMYESLCKNPDWHFVSKFSPKK